MVALGGGSVGDFAGFFASVCKRGLPLIQIPSTWLAAIDSAHGGKNALNVGSMKNQLGTIAFARRIFLSKHLLCGQPTERAQEAMGELAKIAIIDGGPWVKELLAAPESDGELLWRFLSCAVAAKYKVVLSDPLERLSVRHQLNLGHTIGHILEIQHQLPHGLAVAQGLHFALELSTRVVMKRSPVLGEDLPSPSVEPFNRAVDQATCAAWVIVSVFHGLCLSSASSPRKLAIKGPPQPSFEEPREIVSLKDARRHRRRRSS